MASGRRLAAVVFTDTVGFTASMQANEGGSLDLLRQQAELLRPLIALHHGREIKSTGDGFLVEFDSALKAVQWAINVQRRIYERNTEDGSVPIRIRIGVHLGDVVEHGNDILGDAVNIAARIEPLADAGGICVSDAVYEQVRSKVPDKFEKLAAKSLKGVALPMDVYRVQLPWLDHGAGAEDEAGAVAARNRLAVLPFANISPDPTDEYFADGLTEELIASLSLVPGLKVIARTSVVGYKKTDKSVATIGKQLGVGTVVEGSVRRAANRIRVTVQVIDVATEEHLWTAKYDDDLSDIFRVQSDIATRVSTSLAGRLETTTAPVPELAKPAETEAYLLYLQGQALMWKSDAESLRRSLEYFQRSLQLDPTYARAYAALARTYIEIGNQGRLPFMEACKLGTSAAEKAIAIDPDLAEAHGFRAELAFMQDEPADVLDREVRRALELNPNLAQGHYILGALAGSLGITEAYVEQGEQAYRLDPLSPLTFRYLGNAYFFAGRIEDARRHWEGSLERDPVGAYRGLSDYYILKGDLAQAEAMVQEIERLDATGDFAYLQRGYLAAVKGDRETALKIIARLEAEYPPGHSRRSSIGFIYYGLNDLDRFFEYMEEAARAHTMQLSRIRMSPLYAAARKDPRFVQLLSNFGRPIQAPK